VRRSVGGTLGWIVILYLSVVLLLCVVLFFPNNDKAYYRDYKKYELTISASFNKTVSEVEKYKSLYYSNKLSKRQMIAHLERGADALDELYDSFKWKKGDEVTKELYALKKQIIINYAQLYRNKAGSLEEEYYYNEESEMAYITTIIDRYNTKDKLQKEKFNIKF
jgi:hypothetical protein